MQQLLQVAHYRNKNPWKEKIMIKPGDKNISLK